MKTAEWQCTVCGATNRKLVPDAARRATDRCVTCHTAHQIEEADRPVRWNARSNAKRQLSKAARLGPSLQPTSPSEIAVDSPPTPAHPGEGGIPRDAA